MKCLNCKQEVYNYDFCPHCSTPLTDKAKQIKIQENNNIRLETLLKVSTILEDEESLILIRELANKLSK